MNSCGQCGIRRTPFRFLTKAAYEAVPRMPQAQSARVNGAMKTAIVIGAGIAGLSAALALQQCGIAPLLVDQDAAPPAPDTDPAAWPRHGAPQVRQPHFFMGRLLRLLKTRHPRLIDALLAAGVWEIPFSSTIHPAVRGRYKAAPGDAELTALVARRTTFELVLHQYVRDAGIAILSNTKAISLLFAPSMHGVSVRGVRVMDTEASAASNNVRVRRDGMTDDLSRELFADVVIDASGRRGNFAAQLRAAGAQIDDEQHDSRVIYFTRHYRFLEGVARPAMDGVIGVEFPDYTVGALAADNGYFTVTIAPPSDDEEMKRTLRHVESFERICHGVAPIAAWTNSAVAAPVSDVYAFGAMDCFWRRTIAAGVPQVLGLHFIGDTAVRTNPKYGRGCTWSCEQAHALADLLATSPTPEQTALQYDKWLTERFRADWETTLTLDRAARARYERFVQGAAPRGGSQTGATSLREESRGVLRWGRRLRGALADAFEEYGVKTALLVDPVVLRAIMTGYHGFARMDGWTRRPGIWLRILWAWATQVRWRAVLTPYRTKPARV